MCIHLTFSISILFPFFFYLSPNFKQAKKMEIKRRKMKKINALFLSMVMDFICAMFILSFSFLKDLLTYDSHIFILRIQNIDFVSVPFSRNRIKQEENLRMTAKPKNLFDDDDDDFSVFKWWWWASIIIIIIRTANLIQKLFFFFFFFILSRHSLRFGIAFTAMLPFTAAIHKFSYLFGPKTGYLYWWL